MVITLVSFEISFAVQNDDDAYGVTDRDGYLENHYKIELEDLELSYNPDDSVEVEIEPDLTRKEKKETIDEKETLEYLLDKYDEGLEALLSESIEQESEDDTELMALFATECPLKTNEDGYLDRIEADEVDNSTDSIAIKANCFCLEKAFAAEKKKATGSSTSGGNGNFIFFTSVSRSKKADTNGKYKYTCMSKGTWKVNSPKGGE